MCERLTMASLTYSVQDRSILLPHYKRFLVEPFIRYIPEWVDPNAITHGGHLVNLFALALLVACAPRFDRGWIFFLVPLLVHVWLWCDHADGGHARRVGKCSAKGEFLDHGLDLLNATYVICMTIAVLGAPPLWSAAAAVSVTGAAAIIYWEQAETGVFQLGMMTQIESVFSLTGVLLVRGFFGASALNHFSFRGVSLPIMLLILVTGVALFGMLRAAMRVATHGGKLAPFYAQGAFALAFAAALLTHTFGTLSAILVGCSVFLFLGLRALEQRLSGEKPKTERSVYGAALIVGLVTFGHTQTQATALEWASCALLSGYFTARSWQSAGGALQAVLRLDRA
jgi:phosphatidylglycerophosphate synthase